jgi:signal transduction histidine kinase
MVTGILWTGGYLLPAIGIENLIENGIVHNDSTATARVTVGAIAEDDRVRLRVADNGSGIPLSELQVLRRREETQLEHGSGIGLWVVSWIVELCHGELEFENTGRGCTVTIELPPAESDPMAEIPTDIIGDLDIGESTAAVED